MVAMKILGLSGSPANPSKTVVALELALKAAGACGSDVETELVNIRDYDVQFCDGRDPSKYEGDTRLLIDKIIQCDGILIGTPMYRGTYTGILKNMFDLIPNDALHGKPAGLVATGGSDHHFLAIEHELKPILGFFFAHAIPGGVYVNNSHYSSQSLTDEGVKSRLAQIGQTVVEFVRRLPRDQSRLTGADAPEVKRTPLSPAPVA
jgi:FMN reductase